MCACVQKLFFFLSFFVGKTLVVKEECQQNQDPLTLLREYTLNLKLGEIEERDNQIIFGEHSFPKTLKTNYLIWQ